jgi:S1-C subfamily serine protease
MKKVTLYSKSGRSRAESGSTPPTDSEHQTPESSETDRIKGHSRLRALCVRFERPLLITAGIVFAGVLAAIHATMTPAPTPITQQDIDAAVVHTLETKEFPSHAAKAYEGVYRSVVRVRGIGNEDREDGHVSEGIGSGVVIVDSGVILTNMHVIAGAERIEVEFFDGMRAEATVVGVRPEHDLAILQAKQLPDDLPAATLRSTADLAMGDEVIAVGFPFGIGPSVSAGVVSGLRREYGARDSKQRLTNLIQFDAAVNPGNSGGPLVTANGEVVGIVTAILNPTEQHVFIGIGFAVPIENAAAAVGISPF